MNGSRPAAVPRLVGSIAIHRRPTLRLTSCTPHPCERGRHDRFAPRDGYAPRQRRPKAGKRRVTVALRRETVVCSSEPSSTERARATGYRVGLNWRRRLAPADSALDFRRRSVVVGGEGIRADDGCSRVRHLSSRPILQSESGDPNPQMIQVRQHLGPGQGRFRKASPNPQSTVRAGGQGGDWGDWTLKRSNPSIRIPNPQSTPSPAGGLAKRTESFSPNPLSEAPGEGTGEKESEQREREISAVNNTSQSERILIQK